MQKSTFGRLSQRLLMVEKKAARCFHKVFRFDKDGFRKMH